MLSESINTTREDFYPETTEYWVVTDRAEGPIRTAGSFETLVDPVVWPELLVFFIGDADSGEVDDSQYPHTWKFGHQESMFTSGVKPFTLYIGSEVGEDRRIDGNVIESLSIGGAARDVVSCSVGIIGSGDENLITAVDPDWTAYTEPYMTFASATTFEVGDVSRLTGGTAPTVEAFRLNFNRGFDSDYYVQGNRFLAAPLMSGMASLTGSIDFSWTAQAEHQRFLSAIGASATAGDQASFELDIMLRGALVGAATYNEIQFTMPVVNYTASTASVTARDRIVQTVDFVARGDKTDGACDIVVRNGTATYT